MVLEHIVLDCKSPVSRGQNLKKARSCCYFFRYLLQFWFSVKQQKKSTTRTMLMFAIIFSYISVWSEVHPEFALWIGARKSAGEASTWQWRDSESPWGYVNWDPTEAGYPFGDSGISQCGYMFYLSSGKWRNTYDPFGCNHEHYRTFFVCEMKAKAYEQCCLSFIPDEWPQRCKTQ